MDQALRDWYDMRKKAIHEKVGVHDVLRANGVNFRNVGDREEQFSCPFHGKDEKPSARVFPTTSQGPSHAWCYVCRERWDVIALWQKYNGGTFHQTLSDIERNYGIGTPAVPEGAWQKVQTGSDKQKGEFEKLYEACESRLISERDAYDMSSYLICGSVLDKALSQITSGQLSYADGIQLMRKLMQKIGEKIRGVSKRENSNA